MQRYFQVNTSRFTEVQSDTVTHIFLQLHKYQPERQKAFSFIGTIARNYLHELLVRQPQTVNVAKIEYSLDNTFEDGTPISERYTEGIQYKTVVKIDFEGVLKHFDKIEARILKQLGRGIQNDYYIAARNNKVANELEYLKLCKEYVQKFQNINIENMIDYCYHNHSANLTTGKAVYYLKSLFGIHGSLPPDDYVGNDEVKGWNYSNDDWTDDDSVFNNRIRHRRIKKRMDNEDGKYDYF